MNTQPQPIIVQSEGGDKLHFPGGDVASIMLNTQQTRGTLAVLACTQAPDSGPPLHIHSNEDELFLIVEGHYSFFVKERWVEVEAGGAVYLPRGIPHRYRNIGATIGRHWVITTPSGWEKFMARFANELANPAGPNPDRIAEITREHGIEHIQTNQS